MSSEPGGFRVRPSVRSSEYRVAIECAYTENAHPPAIRAALIECYGEALAELDRRFDGTQDDRRRTSATERR